MRTQSFLIGQRGSAAKGNEKGFEGQASHLVEVFEAAGAEEHEREEHEVVAGVDHGAGGERAGAEADPAEDKAHKDQQEKRAEGPGRLEAVHERERQAGDDGAGDHGREGPVRVSVFVERAAGRSGALFDAPVPCGAERRQEKSAKGHLFEEWGESYAEAEEHPCGTGSLK